MVWSRWFRRGERSSARGRQVPPHARQAAHPGPPEVIPLEVEQLAAAWRDASGRLAIAAPSPLAEGRRVLVKVSGAGGALGPLAGVVASSGAQGTTPRVEIELDADQRGAVVRLLDYLKTGKGAPRPRAPRYPLALPVFLSSGGGNTFTTTFSVSRGGCGLAWSGPPPRVGSMLDLRLGSGAGAAAFRAMVCWVREHRSGRRVGVRFVAGQEGALVALIKAALEAAPGARPARRT